jgi:lipoprotein Spr
MHAALSFQESKQRTAVPKQVVGLAAVLLTGAAVTPMNMQIAEMPATGTKVIKQADKRITDLTLQPVVNLKVMEGKDGAEIFSCANVSTISLIEAKKELLESKDNIIASVLSWQGISYKWGGRTKAGVDCSGLVQRVFRENGIQLPRSSYEQFRIGVGIPKAKLESCDLVFFNTNGSGASHVGIYLGDGQFISATKNCVEIQSLDEPYWAKTYRGSRRVI